MLITRSIILVLVPNSWFVPWGCSADQEMGNIFAFLLCSTSVLSFMAITNTVVWNVTWQRNSSRKFKSMSRSCCFFLWSLFVTYFCLCVVAPVEQSSGCVPLLCFRPCIHNSNRCVWISWGFSSISRLCQPWKWELIKLSKQAPSRARL